MVTQHQAITFLSGFQKGLLFFLGFRQIFSNMAVFVFHQEWMSTPKAVGKVNRQNLQITGITVKTVKNTKVIFYFADINLVIGITGSG